MEFDLARLARLSGIRDSEMLLAEEEEADGEILEESAPVRAPKTTRLTEATLRQIVREELEAVVQEMKTQENDSSWLFNGMNKPSNSQKGRVTLGFGGLGFK